jgi:hypothetical protein
MATKEPPSTAQELPGRLQGFLAVGPRQAVLVHLQQGAVLDETASSSSDILLEAAVPLRVGDDGDEPLFNELEENPFRIIGKRFKDGELD